MAEKRAVGQAEQGWTHHRVIGEYQQYFFKRFLKLEPNILQTMVSEKVIGKKVKAAIEASDCDVDYFLAIIKKKNVKKFAKFLEVLEDTFYCNEDHKTLVSSMSKHLLLISDAQPEEKEIIERVVRRAQQMGTEGEQTSKSRQQTRTETESQTVLPEESKLIPQQQFGTPPKTTAAITSRQESLIEISKGILGAEGRGTKGAEGVTVGPSELNEEVVELCEDQITETMAGLNVHVAKDPRVNPPKGFIEPRLVDFFLRERLVNDNWVFHSQEHGVTISIHKDAVPTDIDTFAVKMHTYLFGPFKIPAEYEICTAIFLIQIHPKFKFLKPVTLKMPHSVLFDDYDQPDDFVVLRALDPDSLMPKDQDTHASILAGVHSVIPSDTHSTIQSDSISTSQSNSGTDIHPDTHTPVPPVYVFNNIVGNADLSEDYYMQVELDHFSAVAGAKKRRHRRPKSALSLNLSRQGSLNKQRRSRRSLMKKRIKKVQKGDSIGSSRQSSYEGSFDKEISLRWQQSPLLRQCSSAESDGPFPKQLQRQAAIQREDGYSGMPSPLQQQSSSIEDVSCNEICVCCCSPVQCTTNWTTRFVVAPNHPTGLIALHAAAKKFEKRCCVDLEPIMQIAFPSNYFIGFEPGKWSNSDWIVSATATPQIHLDLVQRSEQLEKLPHIDFEVENTTNQCCSASLHHKITVTGAEVNGVVVYFTIKSTERQVKHQCDIIHTQSWLYQEGSQLLQALENMCDVTLNLRPNHYKLIADIAFQVPNRVYEDLWKELDFSEAVRDQLEAGEKRNLPECVYGTLLNYISERMLSLNDLKSILAKVGIRDIQLCCSDIPLLAENPGLYDRPCDFQLCTELAEVVGMQWQFLGRYLGLTKVDIDDLASIADRESRTEASSRMLHKWQQQCGREASVAALVKAVYRIHQLNSQCVGELWWLLQDKIAHEILQSD